MSEEINFIPYEEARELVANVVEEEHVKETNRRILTVYDHKNREMCWFDAEEVVAEVGGAPKKRPYEQEKEEIKLAAVDYVLHRIPDWCRPQE
ncbi:hypothetical protein ACOHYD_02590 [Desulfobacterota bacterium M19]